MRKGQEHLPNLSEQSTHRAVSVVQLDRRWVLDAVRVACSGCRRKLLSSLEPSQGALAGGSLLPGLQRWSALRPCCCRRRAASHASSMSTRCRSGGLRRDRQWQRSVGHRTGQPRGHIRPLHNSSQPAGQLTGWDQVTPRLHPQLFSRRTCIIGIHADRPLQLSFRDDGTCM